MDNLNTPDNMSKNTHTKLFKLQFSGASGNNTKVTQYIYSSRQCFSLSAIIFIIITTSSAIIILNSSTGIVSNVIIYNQPKHGGGEKSLSTFQFLQSFFNLLWYNGV